MKTTDRFGGVTRGAARGRCRGRTPAAVLGACGVLLLAACDGKPAPTASGDGSGTPGAPEPRADAGPGLAVGDLAPDAMVTAMDGTQVSLASMYANGPVVITFYRGGWCPICTRALSAWAGRMGELRDAGGTFVALTPEKPDLAAATRAGAGGDYAVYSDGAFEAARAFRVHFEVDGETKRQYEEYGLDVAGANVSGTWELPAPATFVIDKGGVVRWAFADWDYAKRADPAAVIAAVRSAAAGG